MAHDSLRTIAHGALVLSPSPWLRYADGRHRVQDGVALNAQDPPGPSFNYAAVLGTAPPLARVLEIADAFFAGKAGGYGVLVEGDAGHPVEAELRQCGWKVFEDEPALVMPRIPSCTEAAPPAGLTIRPVRDEAGLRDFSQTVGAAFELPPEQSAQLIPGMAVALDPDIGLFVGTLDGRAVATGMLYRVDGVTAITGMATLPPYRGRGFGAALLWAALAEGVRRGSTEAALRSGPLSVPLYRRLGFLPACQHRTYVASEPGTR